MLQHASGPVQTDEPPEFSLVLGGPLFQVCRRAHLSGDALELVHRRVLVIVLMAWLPLFVLSVIDDRAFTGAIRIPFLHDVETHVRFLLALPLLIIAEVIVNVRISPLVYRFVDRRIIRTRDLPKFNAAVISALQARNSVAVEAVLLALVYTLGFWLWRTAVAADAATWYAETNATGVHFTRAGYWYTFFSIPLFQFILLRWYVRLLLWFRLLWNISRLDLHLTAAHPDGAGGIGFLGHSAYAFSPILFAQGAVAAGMIATRILYTGKTLPAFEMEMLSWIGAAVLFILGPLVMFLPHLDRAWRKGVTEYGRLASRYIFRFEERWMHGDPNRTGALLGSPDIQSLSDLATSHQVVNATSLVPFGKTDVIGLIVAAGAPFLPLTLTMFSAEELFGRMFKLFFR